MNKPSETDQIERSILINAPRSRVWRALSNAEEFGNWFGAALPGQTFAPGQRARGRIIIPGYDHPFDIIVERMEPEKLLSYRWHPYCVDPKIDYSQEKRTLVTFTLEDAAGGSTLLKVCESGFDDVPPSRRMEAFRMHTNGWDAQLQNIQRYAQAR